MLCKFLEQRGVGLPKITEGDWAPWKHMRFPPLDYTVQRTFRALYVVADPRDAILSVFRRGYQHWHIQRLEGDVGSWDYSWDLVQFLTEGHDHFRLMEHLDNWVKARRSYPIMIIKYDAIWQHLQEVLDFMGLPLGCTAEFPRKEVRSADWTSEPKEIRDALNRIYGELAEVIEMMADINTVLPQQSYGSRCTAAP